jgi:hypothetical protein
MNLQYKIIAIAFAAALLSGCPMEKPPSCYSDVVSYPGGKCVAYYHRAENFDGVKVAEAMVNCTIKGEDRSGTVVELDNLKKGIGLRWINANTLEVAVPKGVRLNNQLTSDKYLGQQLQYRYRELKPNESAVLRCDPR